MANSYTTPVSSTVSPDAVLINIIEQYRRTTFTVIVTVAANRYVRGIYSSRKKALIAAARVLSTVGPAFQPLIVMRTAGGIPYYVVWESNYIPPVGWAGAWV